MKKREDAIIYGIGSYLPLDDEVLDVAILDRSSKDFIMGRAYLGEDYYYRYRGELMTDLIDDESKLEPGIYKIMSTGEIKIVEPRTDQEKDFYTYEGKITSTDPQKIIDAVNNQQITLINIPESSKLFIPQVNKDDDILKRAIKEALIAKGIDIDQYRTRFSDKNALFNFKQVIKGDNRLSIMLFTRGCEALDLKYTIMIEDNHPTNPVGKPLDDPIVVSSEDTYEI